MLRQTSRIVTIVLLSAGLWVIASVGLVAGCPGTPGGGGGDPVDGEAGRPCFANGTCNEGFSCEENTCVDATGEAEAAEEEGEGEIELDWFTSSCSELGGEQTALGACSIPCSTDSDCPVPGLECGWGGQQHCYPRFSCSVDSDCGPSGWYCRPWGCYLECTEPTSGQSSECPTGWSCSIPGTTPPTPFCVSDVGGLGPTPCPSRCQSSSGICCRPPSCAGDCIGSPCCR